MNAQDIAGLNDADRKLLERYLALPEAARGEALDDIAEKVVRFGSFASYKQRGFFTHLLKDAEQEQPAQRGLPLQEAIDDANAPDSTFGLRRAVREEIQRHDETRGKLEESQGLNEKLRRIGDDLRRSQDALQAEVNALRVEVKRLSNAAPLDVSLSTQKAQAVRALADEVGRSTREAVLAILSPQALDPGAERERLARANGERKRTPVDMEETIREFKCRECGEKHPESFAATENTAICRWCSGEEDTTEDPDAGSPEGSTHVTGTCRKCGKFGMVRTHVRRCEACMPVPEAPAVSPSGKTKAEAPEVPAANLSGKPRLQMCETCGRFKIGNHSCS